ncbi:MAG TPA: 50S ribosomal protein L32, partial [Firmicutes bacterium]|nr:50S ribosomal protein L32 [Bacillota bacterium]
LVACPHCGEMIRSHHVCPKCGYYNGKEVLHIAKEEDAPTK